MPKKDARRILEPGYEIGGPVFRERLWLFSSYIPQIDTTNRTTTTAPSTTSTTSDHRWYPDHAILSGASKDQLKSMPQFKYN